ncbi:MAG: phosphoglucosamine mutase [bacterium]|nr:phosphoglucosamine mutase [bacterium]
MNKFFGTDGIRGVANIYPMDPETILKIGRACASVFKSKGQSRIIIGRDTRISGTMIENALVAGLTSMGTICMKAEVLPTPAIAYLVKKLGCEAGIIISASHNPMPDNGIKIIGNDGLKLLDELEERIENNIENERIKKEVIGSDIGYEEDVKDANSLYIQFLKSILKVKNLNNIKVVLDCAHGATSLIAPKLFKELGAQIIPINNAPNGTNINFKCGSLYPEVASKAVLKHNADIGISFDGDGDRLIAIDEKGNVIDGDFIMLICANYLKEKNMLKNNLLIITQMSNFGLEKALKELDINFIRTKVGDRYVIREMINRDAMIGGEQSGHIIFRDISNTGDGIVSALRLIEIMVAKNKPLSKLASIMKRYPQVLSNIKIREKRGFEEMPDVKKAIMEGEKKIGNNGRILVRYSGTEFLARVMVEGNSQEKIIKIVKSISGAIEKCIGI